MFHGSIKSQSGFVKLAPPVTFIALQLYTSTTRHIDLNISSAGDLVK